jgi:hypothetical protein
MPLPAPAAHNRIMGAASAGRALGYCWCLLAVAGAATRYLRKQSSVCDQSEDCKGTLSFSNGKDLVYYRTYPLDTPNDEIRFGVIVLHGDRRTPNSYFDYAVQAAKDEGNNVLEESMIIAPLFKTDEDNPTGNEMYWTYEGWKIGDESLDSSKTSSFTILDEIITKFCTPFPNLEKLTLIGHSAGGQMTNRYIAGGKGWACPQLQNVTMQYAPMNPGSYLYLDKFRPEENGDAFAIPNSNDCPEYNDYKYGLDNLNQYMSAVDAETLISQMTSRQSYYLGGTEDVESEELDVSCMANLQGPNRYERFKNYNRYTERFPGWDKNSIFHGVEGVGHSAEGMFQSSEARDVMF